MSTSIEITKDNQNEHPYEKEVWLPNQGPGENVSLEIYTARRAFSDKDGKVNVEKFGKGDVYHQYSVKYGNVFYSVNMRGADETPYAEHLFDRQTYQEMRNTLISLWPLLESELPTKIYAEVDDG